MPWRWHHDDDAFDAGDLGRHGIHQHRARIARRAARHVEPDRLDRCPAPAEFDAGGIRVTIIPGLLPLVMRADTVAREMQRFDCPWIGLGIGSGNVVPGDGDAQRAEVAAAEFLRVVDQGLVAVGADARDNVAHHGVDIGGHFPLGRQEGRETLLEIGIGLAKRDGHGTLKPCGRGVTWLPTRRLNRQGGPRCTRHRA